MLRRSLDNDDDDDYLTSPFQVGHFIYFLTFQREIRVGSVRDRTLMRPPKEFICGNTSHLNDENETLVHNRLANMPLVFATVASCSL